MKVPFGLHEETGSYRGVDEVERGSACHCICPSCKMKLLARKGDERDHHFSHFEKSKKVHCEYSFWVSVRDAAKQAIVSHKQLYFSEISTCSSLSTPFTKGVIREATANPHVKGYQFDIKLSTSAGTFYIYFLTDKEDVGRARDHYVNRGIYLNLYSVLEIDLSSMKKHTKHAKKHLWHLLFECKKNKQLLLPEKKFTTYSMSTYSIHPPQAPPVNFHGNTPEIKAFNRLAPWIKEEANEFYIYCINRQREEEFCIQRHHESFYTGFLEIMEMDVEQDVKLFFVRCYGEHYGVLFNKRNYFVYTMDKEGLVPLPIKEKSFYHIEKKLIRYRLDEISRLF